MSFEVFTSHGKFLMLALDHRQGMKSLMGEETPEGELIVLKRLIIEAVIDQCSGLLIDEELGLPAYVRRTKPYLLPLEKTGYEEVSGERFTKLQYEASNLIALGASGAKLLLYFNPTFPNAQRQLELAKEALKDCLKHSFPLFIEIVTYGEKSEEEKKMLVVEGVKAFLDAQVVPDVFKIEYPGDAVSSSKITQMLGSTPWILLSGGDHFETFREHVRVAIHAGARGFLAGRALWQELPGLIGGEKEAFLLKTLPNRFGSLSEIAQAG